MRSRKIRLFILVICLTASLDACAQMPKASVSTDQSGKPSISSSSTSNTDRTSSGNQSIQNSTPTVPGNDSNNLYFFNGKSKQTYNGTFLFNNDIKKDVTLNIVKFANLKDGFLYSLKIDSVDGVPSNRLDLGYYYVLQNKIYKIDSQNNHISELENSGSIPSGSAIVCQDNELKDSLGSSKGWHQSIEINDDKRLYKSYTDGVESGYYENITWQRNKGIIEFQSGYGADKNSMDLKIK